MAYKLLEIIMILTGICAAAALLDQVMSLTATQIDLLPTEQRNQVLALQQQLVSTVSLVAPLDYLLKGCTRLL